MQKHAERPEKRTAIPGLALAAMNRMSNVAVTDHPYWPKVSPDSAATSAEAMQQQQQQQQNQYDFAMGQHASSEHLHHRILLEHHRTLNGNGDDTGANNGGSTNNNGGNGEDLVISRQNATNIAQHLVAQNTTVSASAGANGGGSNNGPSVNSNSYDAASITKAAAQSAFTPINSMPHLNSLGHHPMAQRPYLYDAINFQSKNVNQNSSNSFPNQLISLHQIRNYAHQPGAGGLMPAEHLLGIGVGGGGNSVKDKVQ